MENNSNTIISWLIEGCLWELLAAITLTIMARIFSSIYKVRWEHKHELRFWLTGIIGLTIAFCILNFGLIKPIRGQNQKVPIPNFHCEIANGFLSKEADGKIQVILLIKIVNSGGPSVAWKWHLKTALTSGQSFDSDASENPSQLFSSADRQTPVLKSDTYIPNVVLENAVSTGSGKKGWVGFDVSEISPEDIERIGNKFTISFQDADGRIFQSSRTVLKKVQGDVIF
jgi:hypothetical protein